MKVYRPVISRVSPLWWLLMAVITVALLFPIYAGVRTVVGVSTMEYAIQGETLEIRYGFDTVTIPLERIDRAEAVQTSGGRRVGGTAMPGLNEGRYTFPETGPIRLFATRTSPLVVIAIGEQLYGITPDRPDEFIQALQGGAAGTFAPAGQRNTAVLLGFFGLSVLLPAGTLGLLMYVSRAARHMTYKLGRQGVEIEAGINRVQVDYSEIKSAALEELPGSPFRTFGISMPGVYFGSFSWKPAGPNLKLYATRLKPMVLIRTDDHTYGISPEDAEEFVAELQKKING